MSAPPGAVESRRRVRGLAARVAAHGTDPDLLVAVLAWVVRPRRSPDGLRRACLDRADEAPPEQLLREVVGEVEADLLEAVEQAVRPWVGLGVRVALVGDPGYPARLAAGWPDTDGPPLLAWRGEDLRDRPTVALVGARRATGYGVGITAWLAESAARAGVRVVSGGAVGIDAAAHDGALGAPGGTAVVLGCGHAVAYPRDHAIAGGLFHRVLEDGGTLLSELLPLARPIPAHVRSRNRIVAALADVVVVVEGGPTSGALLTASAAADRGIPVLAVPGDVRAPGSAAPHRLLSEGAAPCTGPVDLLEAVGGVGATEDEMGPEQPAQAPSSLPPDVLEVLAERWPRPIPIDDLAALTGRPAATLLGSLTRAQLSGELADGPDGVRLRRSPSRTRSSA